ncbi:unnamed protein product, partial [Phaeothamnion confervicola]
FSLAGGYFIVVALLWGWIFDRQRPDIGDVVGATIAWAGVLVMFFWPRS